MNIGVLVPIDPERPAPPPDQRPVGRAALRLRDEGITVVFGDTLHNGHMDGVIATPSGWRAVSDLPLYGLHDRYPSQRRATRYQQAVAQLGAVPMGNPTSLTLLCRDKLACQHFLEARGVTQPPVVSKPDTFAWHLARWGAAFLKPRFGALGTSVQRVTPGDPLPATLPGVVPGVDDPSILQRAVPPPTGWGGRSVRVLCQREADGGWFLNPAVLRQSREDPVVNAARGAQVAVAADVLDPPTLARLRALATQTCEALSTHPEGELLVELGVDLVLDDHDQPHLIEVNSRPRGRLEVLAALDPSRFAEAHVAACARPLRALAAF